MPRGAREPTELALAALAMLLVACGRDGTAPGRPAEVTLPPPTVGTMELGRAYTAAFYVGAADALWTRLSIDLRAAFGDVAGLRAFGERVRADAGQERAVVEERLIRWIGSTIYVRKGSFTRRDTPVLVQWTLDPSAVALGFSVTPEAPPAASRFLQHQTRTPLRLPVSGEWFVFWGGRDVVDNYHAVAPDQRYAVDLVMVRDANTHVGAGAANDDYHCFGEPIRAPGDGTVAATASGIDDNRPGVMNAAQALGNHVVIDHGNGEFSFLAHLQAGSVTVQSGAPVRAGDVVGRCGNSGNSSEPHLHYHLQTTATFAAGEGLPAQFADYTADGVAVARGEPRRGETIRAP